ncbi:hypothetical protein WMY93_014210 [Mugilogobius chulae]|uniref:ASD2 domain-containing protein n=1 Tax=Mugilogobius chulae TaxID=88201 RepID=A0AAW0NTT4_9GOBI
MPPLAPPPRSGPVLRPHSWHQDTRTPEHTSPPPPPPPPSPPCLPPCDSAPLPPPPPPCAMQLHPGTCSLPWHNQPHSDLSIQWGPPLSRPYSSTDRSSSLGSMESLDTPTPTPQTNYDSHISPIDSALFSDKRDSAYSSFSASSNTSDYATVPLRFGEGESMENLLQTLASNGNANQGLDNGQMIALKSRSLTRPRPKAIEVKERPSSCCYDDERKVCDFGILQNGNSEAKIKSNPPQPPTRKDSFRVAKNRPNAANNHSFSATTETTPSYFEDDLRKAVQNGFPASENDKENSLESCCNPAKLSLTCSKSLNAEPTIYRPQTKQATNVLHRHSAPEKLLATHLQLLQFDNSPIEAYVQPTATNVTSSRCSQWSQPENDQDSSNSHQIYLANGAAVVCQRIKLNVEEIYQKSQENRRRNERFATNLRNEIQRKKAQLQSSRGPGGLLCSGETVHEEGPDFHEELEIPESKPEPTFEHSRTTTESSSVDLNKEVVPSNSVQIVDSGVASFGIRVVEEPAPAGKARRWRWTPEHKLQPEIQSQIQRNHDRLHGIAPSRHGVCSFTPTSTYPRSSSCSRMEESDLLPFADRMKFFEETSKTGVTKPAGHSKQKSYGLEEQDFGTYQSQRRYSYQGGYRQENSSLTEARRQSVNAKERLRQREIQLEEERVREMEKSERMRQWERERELERIKREKEEMERERQEYFGSSLPNYHQQRDHFSSSGSNKSSGSGSAFYPVKGPPQHFDTATQMFPRQQETTKLNRKYSLTERDYSSRRYDPRPVEQSWTHRQTPHSDSNGSGFIPTPLRTRAMSENDLRFEPNQRWSPSLSLTSGSTLSEAEEGFNHDVREKAPKKAPPPRPPPPKWEQFHKRRASHHAIYSSSPQNLTGVICNQSSFELELSRQRSYSLPPQRQELSSASACSKCSCHQDQPSIQNLQQNPQNIHQDQPVAQCNQQNSQEVPTLPRKSYRNLPADQPKPQNPRQNFENQSQEQPNIQKLQQNPQKLHQDQPVAQYNQQNSQEVPPLPRKSYRNLPENPTFPHNLHYNHGYVLQDQSKPQNPRNNFENLPQDQPRIQDLQQNLKNVHQDHPVAQNLPHNEQNLTQDVPISPSPRIDSPNLSENLSLPKDLNDNHEYVLQDRPKSLNPSNDYPDLPEDQTLPQNFQYNHGYVLQDQAKSQNPRNYFESPPQDQMFPQKFQYSQQNVHQEQKLPKYSQYNHQNLPQNQLIQREKPKLPNLHQNFIQNYQQSTQTQEASQLDQVFPNFHAPANQIQAPFVVSSHKQPPEISQTDSLFFSNDIQASRVENQAAYVSSNGDQTANRTAPLHVSSNQILEPLFNIAPPSPMFSRRAFRPVAPPQWNGRGSVSEEEFPAPPPPVADDLDDSLSDSETSHTLTQDQIPISKCTAEWERSTSPMSHSGTVSPPPPPPPPPLPTFPISEQLPSFDLPQKHNSMSESETYNEISDAIEPKNVETESSETLSPAQSLDTDLDVPLETDIDDFQEEELPVASAPISSELPCLALPVTVLETDLDALPEREARSGGAARPDSSLLDEELDVRDEGSLEEIFFPQSSEGESGTESWRAASQSTEHNTDSLDRRSGASSSCSSYYSTSTAKAQLLTQMKDLTEQRERDGQDELMYKKQLMESLRKKLGVLREAQRGLQDDIRANAQLGEEVEAMVVSVCKPNEVDKFRMFIGDLDKVVSLLLSLSGRLLRVETTLDTLESESDQEERVPLQEKKRQLMRQLSEAQDLKEHVDRREQAVSRVLGRCLSPEQHRDYSHFVKMKAALLVEQKQLEDKIRLGEEQLRGLRESLGLGLGLGLGTGLGLAMGYGQY